MNYYPSQDLSIQITLNGFSFVIVDHHSGNVVCNKCYDHCDIDYIFSGEHVLSQNFANVNVLWNVTQVQLMPQTMFNPQNSRAYMVAANLVDFSIPQHTLSGILRVSNIGVQGGVVALWQVDAGILEKLETYLVTNAGRICHCHPLMEEYDCLCHEKMMILNFIDSIVHVSYFHGQNITFGESVDYQSVEALLHLVRKISQEDIFAQLRIHLMGDYPVEVEQDFSSFYQRVTNSKCN